MAINLSDDELEELVEKVTEKVINNFYQSIGESVVKKAIKLIGMGAVALLLYFAGTGQLNIK
jgi:hypothetical protein